MIHLFRRIRHKLFSNGKFTKYLFYAIGEVALVMIGTLLALQVNNWNEHRKNTIRLLNSKRQRLQENRDLSSQ